MAWIIVGMCVMFYVLIIAGHASPDSRDKWEGIMEQRMNIGEERDRVMFKKLDDISNEIKQICTNINKDITDLKIQAAKDGGIYGGAVALAINIIAYLARTLIRKAR